ncbi:MAG: hypothetical protein EZS28_018435 [Streblomastix strix]|uniref:Uncharacterized protein n=1 Tax=Streblomastix strix TaxID=222440 RepID=A0A5J4VV18_9EUKA|nr:MAG: hypothetical protein EZS28_018435 [Streblomastix strix]
MKLDRQITILTDYGAQISAQDVDSVISETDINDENYELSEQMMEVVFHSSYVRRTVAKGYINGGLCHIPNARIVRVNSSYQAISFLSVQQNCAQS